MHRLLTDQSENRSVVGGRSPAADAAVWESDLADLTALPLTSVDGLAPLRPGARLLDEVLRARSSMRGGGEPGRAE
ncbi:hypothetical protein ACWCRF_16035 [Streptomyces sp. NPDC002405]|uniref:hypothetical protein n=1 Tax=Streptomyces sp. NPDC057596 TaxID=3346178 RepID=UPI0036B9438A